MSKLKITDAGLLYKDAVFAGEEAQNITHFVFANVPGVDENTAIDPSAGIPVEHLVHQQPVERISQLNGNAVVMSSVLGYDVGDFEYNYFGAVATKADNTEVLIAVVHTSLQSKSQTQGAQTGNYSVKTIVWRSTNIAEQLSVTLDTLPWQVESSAFVTQEVFDGHNHDANYLLKSEKAADSALFGGKLPSEFAAYTHTHSIAGVTGLQVALNNKLDKDAIAADATRFGGKLPSEYANATHSHSIAQVTGLQTALDAKLGKTATATDSAKLGGLSPDKFAQTTHNHDGVYWKRTEKVTSAQNADDSDRLDGLHASDFARSYRDIKTPTLLGAGVNLNNVTDPGHYYQPSSANAANGANYPTGIAGLLRVEVSAGIQQTYTVYSSLVQFKRTYYANAWGPWRVVYSDQAPPPWSAVSDKPATATRWPQISEISGLQTQLDGKLGATAKAVNSALLNGLNETAFARAARDIKTPEKLYGGANLNDYINPGFYFQESNASAASGSNYPTPVAGTLMVTAAAGIIQTYTTYSTPRTFQRCFYNGIWSSWYAVYSSYQLPPWSSISDKPATATRWPNWSEIGGQISAMSCAGSTGSYGSLTITGSKGGWSGVYYSTANRYWMVSSTIQGFYTGTDWQWRFNNGVLEYGVVPWTRLTNVPIFATRWPTVSEVGAAAASHTHAGHDVKALGHRLTVDSDGKIRANNNSYRQAGMYGIYNASLIGHIWSMGDAYTIDPNGANFGELYGLAYKHVNNTTGGTMADGHQGVWCQNGTPYVAFGNNLWAKNTVDCATLRTRTSSDATLKENVKQVEIDRKALSELVLLTGRYKDNAGELAGQEFIGSIAQKVQAVFPHCVDKREEEHDQHLNGTLTVDYPKLGWNLALAQNSIINEQESRIAKLESLVAQLAEKVGA